MTQAKLPRGYSSNGKSISSMAVGEEGWTTADAMYHDDDFLVWLKGTSIVHDWPTTHPSTDMKVWRDEVGWHVDASGSLTRHWGRGGFIIRSLEPIPVATLKLEK